MIIQHLDGTWKCYSSNNDNNEVAYTCEAQVPGTVHEALLENGLIEDPYFSDNEQHQFWIGERDWVFERSFLLDKDLDDCHHIELVCEGLDTVAEIYINDHLVGNANNQFRQWSFPISQHIRSGENAIRVIFKQTIDYIQIQQKQRYLNATGVGHHRIDGSNRIRKSQCNYGWDWGPMCVTCGFSGSIMLKGVDSPIVSISRLHQNHLDKRVELHIDYSICDYGFLSEICYVETEITLDGNSISHDVWSPFENQLERKVVLEINNPQLWWTHDLGDQPLYTVEVTLKSATGESLSTDTRRIGLRTIKLVQRYDEWGKSFVFSLNGTEIFAKGANWIPADTFTTRLTESDYTYLISSSKEVHMNMLRVWGGGIYEPHLFYDLCDEEGILIWQDFMFACSAYPVYDKQWLENTTIEITQQIKRLCHHPSIALWCGNNEIEQINEELVGEEEGKMTWNEYCYLFDNIIPSIISTTDPDRAYWASSPHTPDGDRLDANNAKSGDAHLWEVWHGRKPFEWYRTSEHRFVSEFGFQSFPQPSAIKKFLEPKDININSYPMDLHQRSPIGNDAILQYSLSWFQLPHDIDMTFWNSQILQGLAMKYAIDHWRRSRPRCMGSLYWQLNDCWPAASWSSIDWLGNWKALQYFAKRFYSPVSITGVESAEKSSCEFWIVNDRKTSLCGKVFWQLIDIEGAILESNQFTINGIEPLSSTKIKEICFPHELDTKSTFISLQYIEDDQIISSDIVLFSRPKYLKIIDPKLNWNLFPHEENHNESILEITAKNPAFWVWIDIDEIKNHYSDNFFHLLPQEKKCIIIPIPYNILNEKNIRIHSLYSCRYGDLERDLS